MEEAKEGEGNESGVVEVVKGGALAAGDTTPVADGCGCGCCVPRSFVFED